MPTYRTPHGAPRGEGTPFASLHREVGWMIERVSRFLSARASASPKVMVTTQPSALDVTVDLGGTAPDRVGVTLSGRTLRIEGGTPGESGQGRPPRPVSRTLSLPFEPRPETVSGSFRNGQLNLRIPRPSPIAQDGWKKMPSLDVIKGA